MEDSLELIPMGQDTYEDSVFCDYDDGYAPRRAVRTRGWYVPADTLVTEMEVKHGGGV